MATVHGTTHRGFEEISAKIDRFESALGDEGLLVTAKEAVVLLAILAKADNPEMYNLQDYLEYGIANRLQGTINSKD